MKKVFLFILIIVSISSCKSKKNTTKSTANMRLIKSVLSNYHKNSFSKETVKATLKIKYEGEKQIPTVSGSLRIEKDKVIWLSISKFISVAKLKITPNKVQYYNNIDKTYFDGDFSLLSSLLGTEVDFNQVQNIFLGEAIYPLDIAHYQITPEGDSFVFTPNVNDERFNILFWLDSESYKTKKQEIHQNGGAKMLSLQYTDFESIEHMLFPKHLYILAKDEDKRNVINIDYKSIKFDLPLRFPFNIPEGYTEIKL